MVINYDETLEVHVNCFSELVNNEYFKKLQEIRGLEGFKKLGGAVNYFINNYNKYKASLNPGNLGKELYKISCELWLTCDKIEPLSRILTRAYCNYATEKIKAMPRDDLLFL